MSTKLCIAGLGVLLSCSAPGAQDVDWLRISQANIGLKDGCNQLAIGNVEHFFAGVCLGHIQAISDLSLVFNYSNVEFLKGICIPKGVTPLDMAHAVSRVSHLVPSNQPAISMMIDIFKLAYPCRVY